MDLPPDVIGFLRWLKIREENGYPLGTVQQLMIDADHSALLPRILRGDTIFPEPPPRSFSYPWYGLMASGREPAFEVSHGPDLLAGPDCLIVNQSVWDILERLGDESFIATYRITDNFRHSKSVTRNASTKWKVYAEGEGDAKTWWVERTG